MESVRSLLIVVFIYTVLPIFALTQDTKELTTQDYNLIVSRNGGKLVTLTTDGNINSDDMERNPFSLSGHNIAYKIIYSQNNVFLVEKQNYDSTSGNITYFICDLNRKNPFLANVRLMLRLRGFSDGWQITSSIDFLVENKKLYATTLIPSVKEGEVEEKHYSELRKRLLKKGYVFLRKAENWQPPQDVYGLEIKSLHSIYTNNF